MGCDIHLWVETFDGSTWKFANPHRICEVGGEPSIWWEEPYVERNYYLFALLADVRNYGSAKIRPISPPKGIPPDVSEIGLRICRERGPEGHSHSWLSASELISYDWSQRSVTQEGRSEGEVCRDFMDRFLPTLNNYGGIERVREVFFFDN